MVLGRRWRWVICAATPKKHFHFGFAQNHQRPDSNWRSDQKAARCEWNDCEYSRSFRPIVIRAVEHLAESLRLAPRSRLGCGIEYLFEPADHTQQAERRIQRSRDYQKDRCRLNLTWLLIHFRSP